MTRNLEHAARGLRDEIDQLARLSASQKADLRQRVDGALAKSGQRKVWVLATWASAAAAVAVALLVWFPDSSPPQWYRIQSGAPCVAPSSKDGDLHVSKDSCGVVEVALGTDSVRMLSKGRLKRAQKGSLRLLKGRASFRVRPRRRSQPRFKVRVSHGTVEVVGGVFEVVQRRVGGTVHVQSGAAVFSWRDGSHSRVEAGGSISWPRVVAEETTLKKRRRRAKRKAKTPDLDTLLRRYLQLVSQRRYDAAVSHLRQALRDRSIASAHRARLSFELGVLLEDTLERRNEACRHWRVHLKKYRKHHFGRQARKRHRRCRRTR